MPILADDASGGAIAVLMALSSIVGGAIIWVANYFSTRRRELRAEARADEKEKRAEKKEDDQSIVDHYEKLNARIDRENAELRREINTVRSNLTATVAHIRYLEGIMESKQIQFRPFDLGVLDSRMHRALETNGSGDDAHVE